MITVIYYYSNGCSICTQQATPAFDQVAQELSTVQMVKKNIDSSQSNFNELQFAGFNATPAYRFQINGMDQVKNQGSLDYTALKEQIEDLALLADQTGGSSGSLSDTLTNFTPPSGGSDKGNSTAGSSTVQKSIDWQKVLICLAIVIGGLWLISKIE